MKKLLHVRYKWTEEYMTLPFYNLKLSFYKFRETFYTEYPYTMGIIITFMDLG
ncbi:hypothetical protein [Flagellimonas sp. 2504JD4-2]